MLARLSKPITGFERKQLNQAWQSMCRKMMDAPLVLNWIQNNRRTMKDP